MTLNCRVTGWQGLVPSNAWHCSTQHTIFPKYSKHSLARCCFHTLPTDSNHPSGLHHTVSFCVFFSSINGKRKKRKSNSKTPSLSNSTKIITVHQDSAPDEDPKPESHQRESQRWEIWGSLNQNLMLLEISTFPTPAYTFFFWLRVSFELLQSLVWQVIWW